MASVIAISSGVAKRLRAGPEEILSRAPGKDQSPPKERGVGRAGTNRVDPDLVANPCLREAPVRAPAGFRLEGDIGGDQDDAARATLSHLPSRGPQCPVDAIEVAARAGLIVIVA